MNADRLVCCAVVDARAVWVYISHSTLSIPFFSPTLSLFFPSVRMDAVDADPLAPFIQRYYYYQDRHAPPSFQALDVTGLDRFETRNMVDYHNP